MTNSIEKEDFQLLIHHYQVKVACYEYMKDDTTFLHNKIDKLNKELYILNGINTKEINVETGNRRVVQDLINRCYLVAEKNEEIALTPEEADPLSWLAASRLQSITEYTEQIKAKNIKLNAENIRLKQEINELNSIIKEEASVERRKIS